MRDENEIPMRFLSCVWCFFLGERKSNGEVVFQMQLNVIEKLCDTSTGSKMADVCRVMNIKNIFRRAAHVCTEIVVILEVDAFCFVSFRARAQLK